MENQDGNELPKLTTCETELRSSSVDLDSLRFVGAVVITVCDSGAGMTEDNLANLFQEGVQFNANQLQNGKGSGIGLWVSKGFVTRHLGSLTATSEGIGLGSTFTVELPAYMPISDPNCMELSLSGDTITIDLEEGRRKASLTDGDAANDNASANAKTTDSNSNSNSTNLPTVNSVMEVVPRLGRRRPTGTSDIVDVEILAHRTDSPPCEELELSPELLGVRKGSGMRSFFSGTTSSISGQNDVEQVDGSTASATDGISMGGGAPTTGSTATGGSSSKYRAHTINTNDVMTVETSNHPSPKTIFKPENIKVSSINYAVPKVYV